MAVSSVVPGSVPGSVIGSKYRVVGLLGTGGMGIVVEAVHELTEKRVAIKRLKPQLAEHPEHVTRMLREAQASARIAHDNVVDIYDVGADGNSVYLVMEYLEGETLGALLAREVLPLDEVLTLLVPAMRGVVEAHALGIVHRDIKPDNIFIARATDGTRVPKVLDFGISKLPRDGESATLTTSGMTLGTPLYMAYEQLTGARDVDARADVYAFGVILYEALTGEAPFRADTVGGLAVLLATSTPRRPSELNPTLPAELDAILLRALARDRALRFQSLEGLITALTPLASLRVSAGAHARVAARRARALADTLEFGGSGALHVPAQKRLGRLVTFAAVPALGLLGFLALRPDAPAPAARAPVDVPVRATVPTPVAASAPESVPSAPDAGPEVVPAPQPRKARERPNAVRPSEVAALPTRDAAPAVEPPASAPAPRLRAGRPTLDQF